MICTHHLAIYTVHYTDNKVVNRACFDPFAVHKKKIYDKGLRCINEEQKAKFEALDISTHVGQKICVNCVLKLAKKEILRPSMDNEPLEVRSSDEDYCPDTSTRDNMERSLSDINDSISDVTSPIKVDTIVKLPKKRRSEYVSLKSEKIRKGFQEKMNRAIVQAGTSLDQPSTSTIDPFEELTNELKVRIRVSSRKEQVKLLTLLPLTWSRERIVREFCVSDRQVKEARKLKEQQGILAEPVATKKGNKPLKANVHKAVIEFYRSSDFVRILPGAKKVVVSRKSDGSKDYEPQRLILCNLTELYSHFCQKHQDMKDDIKISKFCELKPKYCKTVSSSGTHNVCVCIIHQNFNFMAEKVPGLDDFNAIIQMLVCDTSNSDCMMRKCDKCPGRQVVENKLAELFDQHEFDPEDTISYSQWVSTDRTTIVQCTDTVQELIERISAKVDDLTFHHYVKQQQSAYLSDLKKNLPSTEIIIQMDFAENYSFLVQDAAQSFHWNNLQATVHPLVIYFKSSQNELLHMNNVYISDYMSHNQLAVYTMLRDAIPRLLRTLPSRPELIHYFTDGCAGQYKSLKSFCNLMFHKEDFGVDAKCHFFATSHGKSACDGVGAVVKYQARRASLQRTSENFITTPRDLFNFANTSLNGITAL